MVEVVRLVAGLVLLVLGAEMFVRYASRLAARLRIPALIVGLTIVAFGTSAPELVVSAMASAARTARTRPRQRGRQQHLQRAADPRRLRAGDAAPDHHAAGPDRRADHDRGVAPRLADGDGRRLRSLRRRRVDRGPRRLHDVPDQAGASQRGGRARGVHRAGSGGSGRGRRRPRPAGHRARRAGRRVASVPRWRRLPSPDSSVSASW